MCSACDLPGNRETRDIIAADDLALNVAIRVWARLSLYFGGLDFDLDVLSVV